MRLVSFRRNHFLCERQFRHHIYLCSILCLLSPLCGPGPLYYTYALFSVFSLLSPAPAPCTILILYSSSSLSSPGLLYYTSTLRAAGAILSNAFEDIYAHRCKIFQVHEYPKMEKFETIISMFDRLWNSYKILKNPKSRVQYQRGAFLRLFGSRSSQNSNNAAYDRYDSYRLPCKIIPRIETEHSKNFRSMWSHKSSLFGLV